MICHTDGTICCLYIALVRHASHGGFYRSSSWSFGNGEILNTLVIDGHAQNNVRTRTDFRFPAKLLRTFRMLRTLQTFV